MANITIKGIEKLTKRYNKIANMLPTEAVKKTTTFVHAQAKELVPVDTGNLRGSIHMSVQTKGKEVVGRVYTNNDHAMYVEFGTGIRGNGSYPYQVKGLSLSYKSDWQGMVAQPYMYPALKKGREYAKGLFKQDIKENIRKA